MGMGIGIGIEFSMQGGITLGLQLNAASITALNAERSAHSLPPLTAPPVGSDVDATIALFAADTQGVAIQGATIGDGDYSGFVSSQGGTFTVVNNRITAFVASSGG